MQEQLFTVLYDVSLSLSRWMVSGEVPHHPLCLFYFSIINTRSAPPVLPAERWVHTASAEIVVGPASAVSVRKGTVCAAESIDRLFGYFCKKRTYGLMSTAAGYCSFSTPLYMKTMMYKVTAVAYLLVIAVDRHFTCMQ